MAEKNKKDCSNGKIYKIEPICDCDDGEIYIGSTCQKLSQRMTKHRAGYKRWKLEKKKNMMSYKLFEKYGIENCQIILIECIDCKTKDELHAREAFYIKTLNCVNKMMPLRTDKEYRYDNKEVLCERSKTYYVNNKEAVQKRKKEYSEKNKDKIKVKQKYYREKNKDEAKQYNKLYLENNKDDLKQKWKAYYEKNKDAINERRRIKNHEDRKQTDIKV
jgi:hypothetical protein